MPSSKTDYISLILTPWGRAKYVGQTLLTGFTSVLNIYFVFILLLTLYYIIDKIMNLIQCKSEVCSKYYLCKGDPSKAQYYNSGSETCHDSGFNDIKETGDEGEENSNSDPSFVSEGGLLFGTGRGNPNIGRLKSNFYPAWFMGFINENTQGAGIWINSIIISLVSIVYIAVGWNNDGFKILLIILAIGYFIWWGLGIFQSGIDNTGKLCDNEVCISDAECENKEGCKEIGFIKCIEGRCDDSKHTRTMDQFTS